MVMELSAKKAELYKNQTVKELGTKFDFATVVEQLCTKVKNQRKRQDSGSKGKYKHRDKWQKLAYNLPQAIVTCMQGNVTRCCREIILMAHLSKVEDLIWVTM